MQKVSSILGIVTKILTIVALVLVSVVSLATAYIVFAPDEFPKPFRLQYSYTTPVETSTENLPTPTPTEVPLKPGDGIMFNMTTKIINLVDPAGRKYIRLTVVLEFAPDNPEWTSMKAEEQTAYLTAFEKKINDRMPIMDDTIITLLSSKSYEQLYTADGKEALRLEVMRDVQERMPDFKLIYAYFTEFVVQ